LSGRARRVGIEDVAAAAGVSVATVSRAIRGLPNVAQETRERVVRVAEELRYTPDPAAARLAAGKTRTVAVGVPDPRAWYFSKVVGGVDGGLTLAGYDLLLSGLPDQEHKTRFLDLNAPGARRCDAIILIDVALSPEEAVALVAEQYRLVLVGFRYDDFPSVSIDNLSAARCAVTHLLSLGHRRIGLIVMPSSGAMNFVVPPLRRQGYLAAHEAADCAVHPDLVVEAGGSADEVRMASRRLLELPDRPTAVFAMSDEQAFGVMLAARDLGLRIPDDLSVVGVDDHDQSDLVGLTTVRQEVARQGVLAAELLLEVLRGEKVRHVEVPTELIVRSSTAPVN